MLGFGDRKTLSQALTDDDVPTSGFLFAEIAKITHKSVSDCQALEDYLLNQLDKGSLRIKLKVLKILQHLLKDGHHQFRGDLKTRMDGVRAALQLRGPPDPLRGDAYYRDIRAAAQEVMNAVYDTDSRPQLAPQPSSFAPSHSSSGGAPPAERTPMPSMSSMSGGSSFSGGSSGSGGMGMSSDMRSMSSMGSAPAKKELNLFGLIKVPLPSLPGSMGGERSSPTISQSAIAREQERARSTASNLPGMTPSWAQGDSDWSSPTTHQSQMGSWGGNTYSAPSGGSTTQPVSSTAGQGGYESRLAQQSSGSVSAPAPQEPAVPRWPGAPTTMPVSKSSGDLERALVEDVCQLGGVRVAPPPSKLLEFTQRAQSLDNNILAGLLLDKLYAEEPQVRVKALYVVEAVMKQKVGGMRDIFTNELGTFQELAAYENSAIASQAQKVVRQIEGGGSSTPKTGKGPVPRAVEMEPSFLDAPVAPAAGSGASMFDGLDLSSGADHHQLPPSQQPQRSNGHGRQDDPFGLGVSSHTTAAATNATTELFADMTLMPSASNDGDLLSQLDPLKNPSKSTPPMPQQHSAPGQVPPPSAPHPTAYYPQPGYPPYPYPPQPGYPMYPAGYPAGYPAYPSYPGAYPPQRPRGQSIEAAPLPGTMAAGRSSSGGTPAAAATTPSAASGGAKGGFDFISKPKDQFEDIVAQELKHS